MNKSDILKKLVADRTAEEVEFLKTVTDFTEDETKQLETEKADAEKAQADADAAAKVEADKVEAEKAEAAKVEAEKVEAEKVAAEKAEAERKANEGKTVTITASEHAELIKAKESLKAKEEELRRVATEKEIGAIVANEQGGKILPKQAKEVIDMVMTFSESQKTSFLAFVNGLPELKIAGEKGNADANHLTAKEQLSKLVEDKMKASEGKLDKVTATKQVLSENEALAKQYQEEV